MRRWALLFLLIAAISGAKSYGQTCVTASQVTLAGNLRAANGLPSSNYTISFQPSVQGYIAGCGVNTPQTFSCATSIDGSVVGLPNPLTASIVTTAGTGSLTAGTYYSVIAWYDASANVTLAGPETATVLSASGSLVVNPPSSGQPAGAVGMNVYISTTSGAETLQGQTTGTGSYVQSVALTSGASPVTANSTLCKLTANDAIWPTGSGYITSLTDSHGNSVPGYPMQWQLLGAGTTVNLSNGLPYYHGVVQYPVPLLTSPANHGQQSLTGPLNMSGYAITNIGSLSSCITNTSVSVGPTCLTQYTDLGAKVNAAVSLCSAQCTIYIPAGTYNYSTTMSLPLNFFTHLSLQLDQGASLTYTGTGDAIVFPVAGTGPTDSNCSVTGGELFGNASAKSGVHIWATNACNVTNMVIYGFSTGYGVWLDGANAVNVDHNFISNNLTGVYMTPTWCTGINCSDTGSGAVYTPNANHVSFNTITGNSAWAVQEFDTQTGGQTGALNDSVIYNDLELNGTNGNLSGGVSFGMSHGLVVAGNYFEGSPIPIELGIPGGGDANPPRFFASVGTVIRDNYFTELDTHPGPVGTYQINLLDTWDVTIEGNTTLDVSMNGTNCFINTLANNGTTIGETGTVVGKNHVELSGGGQYLCIAGSGVIALAGAKSYQEQNQNYFGGASNVNYQITSAGTSETVATGGNVNSSSICSVTPFNDAAVSAMPSYYFPSGPNTGTLYHPASVNGLRVNISCAPGPFN